MADLEFRTYNANDWLWDYLDSTGTPYRYDPAKRVYIVYASAAKHEYLHSQIELYKKGVKLE